MKAAKRFISENVISLINLRLKGITYRELNKYIEQDNWSQEKIKELQALNLRKFLTYAFKHCPYYTRLFNLHEVNPISEDIFSELRKIPPLSKEVIRENIEEILSREFSNRDKLIVKATGGSAGVPLVIYGDKDDYRANALMVARQRLWVQWKGGMETLNLFGGFRDLPSKFNKFLKRNFLNDKIINIMDASEITYFSVLKMLYKNPPQVLIGYFSALKELAFCAEKKGQPVQKLELIMSCAEPIDNTQRTYIEQWLGAPVYSQYGSRELGTVAQECREKKGYHYAQDMLLCEILDENGQPAEYGNLTITHFTNKVTPMIRYQIGDGASLDYTPCPCGCPYHRIKTIDGRISSMIVLPDGNKITSIIIPHLLKDYPWILSYQAEQTKPEEIKIRVKKKNDLFSQNSFLELDHKLQDLFNNQLSLTWIFDEDFVQVPTGKHVYFISRL